MPQPARGFDQFFQLPATVLAEQFVTLQRNQDVGAAACLLDQVRGLRWKRAPIGSGEIHRVCRERRSPSIGNAPSQLVVQGPGIGDQGIDLVLAPFADHRVAFFRRQDPGVAEHSLYQRSQGRVHL